MVYLVGYFSGKQRIFVRINKMRKSIPILTFLKSVGLTEEKILLSVNDYNILRNLQKDEERTFERLEKKFEIEIPRTRDGIFILLGYILTGKEHNIMWILIK